MDSTIAQQRGWISLPYVEEDRERSQYTSYTSREHQRGPLKKQEARGGERWGDPGNWEWSDYERKWTWVAPKKEGFPEEVCSATLLGFGDFEDWRYGGNLDGQAALCEVSLCR